MRYKLIALTTLASLAFGADLQKGIELYNSKNYGEAVAALNDVVKEEPENADAHAWLGLSLLGEKKTSEAQKEFQKAAELDPKSDRAKVGLARVYIEQKSYDKAKDALSGAGSDNADVPYYQGVASLGKKQYAEAAKQLEKALELNPGNDYAHYYLGVAYSSLKRPDKMVDHFETFLKRQPDAPEAEKVQSVLRAVR